MDENTYSKGQLFLDLEADGVEVKMEVITKAMDGDGQALFSIGYIYDIQHQQYAKAMEWYLLSAYTNHAGAENNIGNLYYTGKGVPIDYLLAVEWYLKAASQKNKFAFENIGRIFEKGLGVLDDKYFALEWYRRNKHTAEAARRLKEKGYHTPLNKKNKKLDQLIKETEEIINKEKIRKSTNVAEEYKPLPPLNTTIKQEMKTASYKPNSIEDDILSIFSLPFQDQSKIKDNGSHRQTDEVLLLKQEKMALEQQIETSYYTIKSLESENHTHQALSIQQSQKINSLEIINQSIARENQALKQSNDALQHELDKQDAQKAKEEIETLTKLLEAKTKETELVKQNMQTLLDKEKQRSNKLEKENRKLKREIRENYMSCTKEKMDFNDDDDPDNDINYDTEDDTHSNESDINYNTPSEHEDDNNDLNYDSEDKDQESNSNTHSKPLL